MDSTNTSVTQVSADPQVSPFMARVLPVALVLALLAVLLGAAVLAEPHLIGLAQSLGHSLLASVSAHPMGCGEAAGSCY